MVIYMKLDWANIDHVLLDMDGTLLDLSFDNYFWSELVPQRYAHENGLSHQEALAHLHPIFEAHAGTLDWYCLDFWSDRLKLPIISMKKQERSKIAIRPGTITFLEALNRHNKHVVMATNAHPVTLQIKLQEAPIEQHFDSLVSSHDLGFAKEDQKFWQSLCEQHDINPQRSLFIDDSEAVLTSAKTFGIEHLLCISQPSSKHAARHLPNWPSVNYLDEVLS